MIIIAGYDKIFRVNDFEGVISIVGPREVLGKLGELSRRVRVQSELTQPELALKSGVPSATISLFERTGRIGTESLLRIFFALGLIDSLNEYLAGRLKLTEFRKDSESPRDDTPRRVRHTRGSK